MRGIYSYISETTRAFTVDGCYVVTICVASNIISHDLRFVVYISTFRSTCTVPSVAAFCGSLSCLPVTLFRYFLYDFDMVAFAPTITDTSSVFVYYCYVTHII